MFRAPMCSSRDGCGRAGSISGYSVIPPWTVRERPQVDLKGPGGSVLSREVKVGLRDLRGKHQSIMFVAPGFSQLLESFRPEHFPQRVGRIHGAVDHDMGHVDSLRCELCVECLAKHSSPSHRSRMRMLPAISTHRRGCRGHEDCSFAARFHQRAYGRREAKQSERSQAPARFKRLERGVLQCPVANLGAQVVNDDFDWTNVGLDSSNPLFDGVWLDRIEEKSGCGTSVVFDGVHHSIQSVQVAAPAQTSVIALLRKASSDISTDTRTGTYHQTNRFHVRSLLRCFETRLIQHQSSVITFLDRRFYFGTLCLTKFYFGT